MKMRLRREINTGLTMGISLLGRPVWTKGPEKRGFSGLLLSGFSEQGEQMGMMMSQFYITATFAFFINAIVLYSLPSF